MGKIYYSTKKNYYQNLLLITFFQILFIFKISATNISIDGIKITIPEGWKEVDEKRLETLQTKVTKITGKTSTLRSGFIPIAKAEEKTHPLITIQIFDNYISFKETVEKLTGLNYDQIEHKSLKASPFESDEYSIYLEKKILISRYFDSTTQAVISSLFLKGKVLTITELYPLKDYIQYKDTFNKLILGVKYEPHLKYENPDFSFISKVQQIRPYHFLSILVLLFGYFLFFKTKIISRK